MTQRRSEQMGQGLQAFSPFAAPVDHGEDRQAGGAHCCDLPFERGSPVDQAVGEQPRARPAGG